MAKNRMFEIIDQMNVADGDNCTQHVSLCNELIRVDKVKGGGHVTVGVPADLLHRIITDPDTRTVLMVLDYKEYNKIEDQ